MLEMPEVIVARADIGHDNDLAFLSPFSGLRKSLLVLIDDSISSLREFVDLITAFYLGLATSPAVASTMAFATLTLARLFHGFNCRGEKSLFQLGLFSNPASVGAFVLGVLLLSLVLFVPALHSLFAVADITGVQVLLILGLAVAPSVLIQLAKLAFGLKKKD